MSEQHSAVTDALHVGEYTDGYGQQWLLREDGWWDTNSSDTGEVLAATQATMATIIEEENR